MKFVLYLLLSGLATNVAEGGLHLATRGLLQTHASLAGRGIALYPAHSPGHETDDVEHLAPARHHVLYYAQEGHRRKLVGYQLAPELLDMEPIVNKLGV